MCAEHACLIPQEETTMKRLLLLVLFVSLAVLPAAALAQGGAAPATDPVSKMVKGSFDTISRYVTASAEKMPEENYGFKPTPEVRSFGQLVAHVANTHFSYCARVKGEKNPNDGNDFEKKTAKADIVKGLADSIAYCAPVYAEMTDAKALEPLPAAAASAPAPPTNMKVAGAQPTPPPPAPAKLQRLLGNVTHDWEHYGNLVTYLRLKGLVPPSSEPRK
jgi:uncharacterized damage-inducible protein DinB